MGQSKSVKMNYVHKVGVAFIKSELKEAMLKNGAEVRGLAVTISEFDRDRERRGQVLYYMAGREIYSMRATPRGDHVFAQEAPYGMGQVCGYLDIMRREKLVRLGGDHDQSEVVLRAKMNDQKHRRGLWGKVVTFTTLYSDLEPFTEQAVCVCSDALGGQAWMGDKWVDKERLALFPVSALGAETREKRVLLEVDLN